MEPATFRFMGLCSSQLSHTSQGQTNGFESFPFKKILQIKSYTEAVVKSKLSPWSRGGDPVLWPPSCSLQWSGALLGAPQHMGLQCSLNKTLFQGFPSACHRGVSDRAGQEFCWASAAPSTRLAPWLSRSGHIASGGIEEQKGTCEWPHADACTFWLASSLHFLSFAFFY